VILGIFPFYDTTKIRSMEFRPISRFVFWFFIADTVILGWIGTQPVEEPFVSIGRYATVFYFGYFIVLQPLIGVIENTLYYNSNLKLNNNK